MKPKTITVRFTGSVFIYTRVRVPEHVKDCIFRTRGFSWRGECVKYVRGDLPSYISRAQRNLRSWKRGGGGGVRQLVVNKINLKKSVATGWKTP